MQSAESECSLKEGATYTVKLANVKDHQIMKLKETTITIKRSTDEAVQNKAEVESVNAVARQ